MPCRYRRVLLKKSLLSFFISTYFFIFYDVSRQIRPQLITFQFNPNKLYTFLISRKLKFILRLFCFIWVIVHIIWSITKCSKGFFFCPTKTRHLYILVSITFILSKRRLFHEPNTLYTVQLSSLQLKLCLLLFVKVQLGHFQKLEDV